MHASYRMLARSGSTCLDHLSREVSSLTAVELPAKLSHRESWLVASALEADLMMRRTRV
jgi:hypothetical protein